jgi:hypothetical protein
MVLRLASAVITVVRLMLSLSFLYFATRLAFVRSDVAARRLLLVSMIYLSTVFVFQALAGF